MSGPPADLAAVLREHADCEGTLTATPGDEPGVTVLTCSGCGGTGTHDMGVVTVASAEREAAERAALAVAVPSRGFAGARYGSSHSSAVGRRRRILRNVLVVFAVVLAAALALRVLDPGEGVDVGPPGPGAAETVTVDGRFSVEVPTGWQVREAEGVTRVVPPGGGASVEVSQERDAGEPEAVAGEVAELLAERHSGAEVEGPVTARDGELLVRASYPGGSERARITVADGRALVVITEVPSGTDPAIQEEAAGVAASVTPETGS